MDCNNNSPWANNKLRLIVTSNCNLNCFYCHNEGQPKSAQYFSDELFDRVLNLIALTKATPPAITFSGGEPLLHPRLEWFATKMSRYCPKITVVTNGTLLTKQRAISLSEAGITKIRLGVDSFRKKSRPSNLFPSSWKVSDTLSIVDSLGIHTEFNVVLTLFNASELRELLKFFYEKRFSVKFFEHVKVIPNGQSNSPHSTFTANPRMGFHYFDSLVKEVTKGAKAVNCPTLGSANQVYQFDGFEFRYCRYLCDFDLCHMTGTRIGPGGSVYTCMENREGCRITPTESIHSSLQSIQHTLKMGCTKVTTFSGEDFIDSRNRVYHQA